MPHFQTLLKQITQERALWVVFALFIFVVPSTANAFCENRKDGSICHPDIVSTALPFLQPIVLATLVGHVNDPDQSGWTKYASDDHFDDCNFDGAVERINKRYKGVMASFPKLNQPSFVTPKSMWEQSTIYALREWALILHAAHDFYSHSNWVEMGYTNPERDIVDKGTGNWSAISSNWGTVRDDVIASQKFVPLWWKVDLGALPDPSWPPAWAKDADTSELRKEFERLAEQVPLGRRIPRITREDGKRYRLLVSGESPAPFGNSCPFYRTYPQAHPLNISMSHDKLNKDNISRRWNREAVEMAIGQTKHEWCRLVARAIKTDVGTAGLLIGLFVKADGDPHPVGTICAKSAEGSIAVEVRVNRINLLRNDRAHPPVTRRFVLSAFAGDFKRSARSRSSVVDSPDSRRVPAEMLPQPLTLCMGPAEQLIVSLQGWEENYRREREDMLGAFPIYMRSVLGGLDHNDYILGGVTHAFSKVQQLAKDGELPVVQQSNIEQMKDLEVAFQVNARAIGCVPQPATH